MLSKHNVHTVLTLQFRLQKKQELMEMNKTLDISEHSFDGGSEWQASISKASQMLVIKFYGSPSKRFWEIFIVLAY